MSEWTGNRADVRYRLNHVSWDTWEEGEEYGYATGGRTEWSYFTALKVAGSIEYNGEAPNAYDMLRCRYEFADEFGHVHVQPLWTMLVETTESAILGTDRGAVESGTANLYSVLKVLSDRLYGLPFTVAAGTLAVSLAQTLAESVGLVVNAKPSTYRVATDHTFAADDSYLTIVNWLLDAAGYGSAYPDAMGTVQMQPYVEPTLRQPVFTFADDTESIMYPSLTDTTDRSETANVVRLCYEDELETLWATAANVDASHPASLPRTGWRELTAYDSVSELEPAYEGEEPDAPTQALRVANLKAAALKQLLDNSADIEYVTLAHAYYPVTQGDPVAVHYGGKRWSGTVTNVELAHEPESKCTTKVRLYVTYDLDTQTNGGVL